MLAKNSLIESIKIHKEWSNDFGRNSILTRTRRNSSSLSESGLIRIFHRQHTARLIPERFTQTHFGLSWSGLIFSIAIAVGLTDWPAGWPLARIRWLSPLDSLMLATASTMLTASASLQLTIYLFKSSRISYLCDHLTRPAPNQSDDWYQDQWDDNPWGNH